MRRLWLLLVCALFAPVPAGADHPVSDEPVLRISAKPIERRAPRYPKSEAIRRSQGWVLLNFVVLEDGSIGDPIVEDSSGVRAFERAALRVVKEWSYEPATVDEEPVEQCHTQIIISFDGPKGQEPGATRKFKRKYVAVIEELKSGSVDEASALLDELAKKKRLNRYEGTRIALLRARIAQAEGDTAKRLGWLEHVSWWGAKHIEPELRESVLKQVFGLQVQQRAYGKALATWQTLEEHADASTIPTALSDAKVAVLELRDSDRAFSVPATIPPPRDEEDTEGVWQYKLLRRMPGLLDIEGSLDRVELRCPWKRVTAKPSEGKAWRIPESWGACDVFVFGEPGASFKLVEWPAETADEPTSTES